MNRKHVELRRESPLAERLAALADELQALAGQGCQEMTKDEVDILWGHD